MSLANDIARSASNEDWLGLAGLKNCFGFKKPDKKRRFLPEFPASGSCDEGGEGGAEVVDVVIVGMVLDGDWKDDTEAEKLSRPCCWNRGTKSGRSKCA